MFRSWRDKRAAKRSAEAAGRDAAEPVDVQSLVSKYVAGRHLVELRTRPAPTQPPSPEPNAESTDRLGTRIAASFADLDEPAFDDLPPRSGHARAAEFPE